jgi:hypothetical protein
VDLDTAILIVLVTVAAFAGAIGVAALGTKLTGRCLRGSCGGPEVPGAHGESLACESCPNRKRAGA